MRHISKLVYKVELIDKVSNEIVQEEFFLTNKKAERFVRNNRITIQNQGLKYIIGGVQLWIF